MSIVEGKSILDDYNKFDWQTCFDLGHPLLNRIAESFVGVRPSESSTYFFAICL